LLVITGNPPVKIHTFTSWNPLGAPQPQIPYFWDQKCPPFVPKAMLNRKMPHEEVEEKRSEL
jgi:Auxin binding protein